MRHVPGWLVLGAWALVITALVSVIWPPAIDFHVYRDAARYVLGGGEQPYDAMFSVGLPFTYPPFALLLFLPFGALGDVVGLFLLRLVSLLALAAVCQLIHRSLPSRSRTTTGWWLLLITGLVATSPVRETLDKGQINLLLLAVCVVALVNLQGFWSGFLIGLAGGVKLTPLALGLVHLKRRDWGAIAGIATGLSTSIAVGFLVLPSASKEFWTSAVRDPGRVGNVAHTANASLRGVLERVFTSPETITWAWVGVSLLVVIAGYMLIPLGNGRLDRVTAAGIAATVMLLISPISWTHHWVWFPILAVAWLQATESLSRALQRSVRILWLLSGLMLVLGPSEIAHLASFTGDEPSWPVSVLGSWIPLTATLALLGTAGARWSSRGDSGEAHAGGVRIVLDNTPMPDQL